MKKNSKKYVLMLALSVFFSVTLLIGGSYALIQKVLVGTNTYAMRTGNFLVEFNESQEITLSNLVPVYDNIGMSTGGEFAFSVSNTGNYVSSYSIKIEKISTDNLSDVVRYAIDYGDGYNYDNIHTLANNKYIIQNKSLAINGIDSYKLRFWLDIDASEEYINKEFSAKVVIEATQEEYKYGPNILEIVYNLDEEGIVAIGTDGQLHTEGDIREYRYSGDNVNNYVWFNCEDGYTNGSNHCEKWRIIGSFENAYENGVATYPMLKIVRDEPLTTQLPFNSNEGNLANFEGSSIQKYLNETYYNSLNQSAKDFSIKARWNIGEAVEYNDANSNYLIEKSVISYNYVGLINVSDYGYAQKMNLSWINEFGTLLINPSLMIGKNVYYMSEVGLSKGSLTTDNYNVRPSMYLKPDVSIVAGYGTIEDPYELTIKFPIEYGVKTETKAQEIIYNLNGASGNIKPTIIGDNITTEVPVREHYSFLGWSTNPHAIEAEYQSGDSYTGQPITLYAVWKGDEYEITFIDYSKNLFNVPGKTQSGLTSTYSSDTNDLTLNGTPTGTHIFSTNMSKGTDNVGDRYLLKLDYVSGTLTNTNNTNIYFTLDIVDSSQANLNPRLYIPLLAPTSSTKTNSRILTINELGASTGKYLKTGITYSTVAGISFTNYKVKPYVIKLDFKNISYGSSYGELPTPTREGYVFKGWYTEENGGELVNSDTIVSIDGNHNLYAQWEKIYQVNFVDYSKNLFTAPGRTQNGITSTYASATNDLTLSGTPTSSHSISWFNNSTYNAGDQYLYRVDYVSGSITNSNNATINFVLEVNNSAQANLSPRNSITIVAPNSSTKTVSKILTVNDLGASEGKYLRSSFTYSTVAGLKFTNYKVRIYVVKLESKDIVSGSAYGELPTPTRDGYTFAGWYTAETGGDLVTNDTIVSTASDHNLYARWIAN